MRTAKAILLGIFIAAALVAGERVAFSAGIGKGQTEEEVLAVLGKPMGKMARGSRMVWFYRQGQADVIGAAASSAAKNRLQYGLQLLGTPLQVMGITGQNLAYDNNIWGSPAMRALNSMVV